MRTLTHNTPWRWIVLLLFFVAAMLHGQAQPHVVDDAFITYRYAANVASGQGMVYNPGEAVLGTTTPGYALLLVPFAALFGSFALPYVSLAINTLFMLVVMANVALVTWQITGHQWSTSVAATGLIAIGPWTRFAASSGMETPVFLALLSGGVLAQVHRRYYIAAFLVGLSVIVRPEGGLMIGLLLVDDLVRFYRQQNAWPRLIRLGALLVLPGLLYASITTAAYGSPLPQSVQAKSAGLYPVSVRDTLLSLAEEISKYNLYPLVAAGVMDEPGYTAMLLSGLITVPITLGGVYWFVHRFPAVWFVPVYMLALWAFYGTSRTLLFPWYLANYEFILLACYGAGWWAMLNRLPRLRRPLTGPLLTTVLMAVVTTMTIELAAPVESFRPPVSGRERLYHQLARQLDPLLPDHVVIAMPEIGAMGYYLPQARILDTAGLVSPEASRYFPVPADQRTGPLVGVIPPRLIHDEQPDMVIFLEIFGRKGLLQDAWFKDHYVLVVDWSDAHIKEFSTEGILVYARRDYAPGLALAPLQILWN